MQLLQLSKLYVNVSAYYWHGPVSFALNPVNVSFSVRTHKSVQMVPFDRICKSSKDEWTVRMDLNLAELFLTIF